jgi:hypothetical protein
MHFQNHMTGGSDVRDKAGRIWVRKVFNCLRFFFSNYTIHRRHSQRTHTHPYEYTHANPTPRSIFEDYAGKSSRLTKSPQAPRCRRKRRLPLKAQTSLNSEKFAPMESQTQELRCYRGSCNHWATTLITNLRIHREPPGRA